jgi:hypothetical protein
MPITLGELNGFISRPEPVRPLDFTPLIQSEQWRQQQELEQRKLAAEQQRAAQAAHAQGLAEAGRMQRAQMRSDREGQKFDWERGQADQRFGEEQRKVREQALSALADARRRGDPDAESLATQALQRLGEKVELGQGPAPEEAPAPPGAPGVQPQAAAGSATGAATARARVPAWLSGVMAADNAPPSGEAAGPATKAAGKAPPAWLTGFMGSDAAGAAPEPGAQSSAVEESGPPDWLIAEARRIGSLEADEPPPASPGPENTPEPAATAPPPPSPAPPAPGVNLGELRVLHGGDPILRLGKPGGDLVSVESIFAPRIKAARNMTERRAAQLGLETAKAVAQREGVDAGVKAGTAAYDKELGLEAQRETAHIRAAGQAASGQRADRTGDVQERKFDQQLLREREDRVRQDYGIKSIGEAEAGLDRLNGMLASDSGFGDQAALTNALRSIGGEKGPLSNQDIARWQRAGGIVSQFQNAINYVTNGGKLNDEFRRSLRVLTGQTRKALEERRREAAKDAYDRVSELQADWDEDKQDRYATQVARQFDSSFKGSRGGRGGAAAPQASPAPAKGASPKPAAAPGNSTRNAFGL